MDEPTVHLDAPHQRRLIQSFKRRAQAGCAVISVLHDLTLALAADRLLVMADGQVLADGPPDSPEVQAMLVSVFDHAFTIETIGHGASRRFSAVPLL
jgi:iron complex transport system ATP-binding protein